LAAAAVPVMVMVVSWLVKSPWAGLYQRLAVPTRVVAGSVQPPW
jgi:hypothetical protein